jgi:hypothetical protein
MVVAADGGAALFAGGLFYPVIVFYEKIPRTKWRQHI